MTNLVFRFFYISITCQNLYLERSAVMYVYLLGDR